MFDVIVHLIVCVSYDLLVVFAARVATLRLASVQIFVLALPFCTLRHHTSRKQYSNHLYYRHSNMNSTIDYDDIVSASLNEEDDIWEFYATNEQDIQVDPIQVKRLCVTFGLDIEHGGFTFNKHILARIVATFPNLDELLLDFDFPLVEHSSPPSSSAKEEVIFFVVDSILKPICSSELQFVGVVPPGFLAVTDKKTFVEIEDAVDLRHKGRLQIGRMLHKEVGGVVRVR